MASPGQSGQERVKHHAVLKVLLLGHSFIAGFKRFLMERDSDEHNVTLNLSQKEFLIQFSGRRGASISQIRADLEIVADFQPDICIIQAGTNDIGSKPGDCMDSDWEEHIAGQLYALAQHLVQAFRVKRVVIMQILHRIHPSRPVRYPVIIDWFNARCDRINHLLYALAQDDRQVRFWKHKGLFQLDHLTAALSTDGTHLNNWVGYPKYFKNIRAALVSMKKELQGI